MLVTTVRFHAWLEETRGESMANALRGKHTWEVKREKAGTALMNAAYVGLIGMVRTL